MIIVLEGVDNSGKSTLAAKLKERIGFQVMPSEGPPRYDGEMEIRLHRYSELDNVIFDRHPIVSQTIYSTIRGGNRGFNPKWEVQFYTRNPFPFFVYCDPCLRGLHGHQRNTIDTDEHLQQIEANYNTLLAFYRVWAIAHANLVYRIGDNMDLVCALVETAWRQSCSTRLETSKNSIESSDSSTTVRLDPSRPS